MPETSFSTRHAGASIVCAGGVNTVHLFKTGTTTVYAVDFEGQPMNVAIECEAKDRNAHDEGLTLIYLDWETACEIARLVDRRNEQVDVERHPAALKLV